MDQINVSVSSVHIFWISFGSIIFGSYELFQKTIQFCSFEFFCCFRLLTTWIFWPLCFFDLFFNFWPFVLLTFKYHDFFIDLFFLPFYLLTFKYYDFLTLLFISIWPLHLSTERSNWNRQKGQKIVIFKGQKVKKKRSIKKS